MARNKTSGNITNKQPANNELVKACEMLASEKASKKIKRED